MANESESIIRPGEYPEFRHESTILNVNTHQIAAASHMVGFDVPNVAQDMILRFMGEEMDLVVGDSATTPSRLGDEDRTQLGIVGQGVNTSGQPASGTNWKGEYCWESSRCSPPPTLNSLLRP